MRALWNHERVVLLRQRGGPRSLGFWLLRKALALDVYTLFALPLRDAGTVCSSPGCTLLRLVSEDDLACLGQAAIRVSTFRQPKVGDARLA